MNRLSDDKWEKEQSQDDGSLPPLKLADKEQGIKYKKKEMTKKSYD